MWLNLPTGGRYSWEFLVGVCRPVLQILTLFQTKKCNFPHPFSDQTSKIHTRFQTWPLGRNYVIITSIRAQTKKLFKSISNSHISLSFSLIWNWNDKYVHTLPYFRRKPYPIPDQNRQSVNPFSEQNGAKPLPDGGDTYLHGLYTGVPLPTPDCLLMDIIVSRPLDIIDE